MTPVGPPPPPFWEREGAVTKVLGGVGAAVTLIGVAFLLVMAADAGWFGATQRVTTGAVLAVVLTAAGVMVQRKKPGNGGAYALVATGYVSAYITLLAVTVVYDWISPTVGLAIAAVLAATGTALAWMWRSQFIAMIVVLGAGILSPFVGGPSEAVSFAFVVLLTLAVSVLWVLRLWPGVAAAAILPTTVAGLYTTSMLFDDPQALVLVSAEALLVGTTVAAIAAGRRRPNDPTGSLAIVLVTFPLWAAAVPFSDAVRTVAYIVPALILLVVPLVWRRSPVHFTICSALAGAVLAFIAIFDAAPENMFLTIVLALAAAYLAGARFSHHRVAAWVGLVLAAVGALAFIAGPVTSVTISRWSIDSAHYMDAVASLLAVVVACLAAAVVADMRPKGTPLGLGPVVLGLVTALPSAAVFLVLALVVIGREGGWGELGFTIGHISATSVWAVVAAFLMLRGFKRLPDPSWSPRLGLVLVFVVLGKLLLFDLAALDGLLRVGLFIGVGLLIILMGVMYASSQGKSDVDGGPAGPGVPGAPGGPGGGRPVPMGGPRPGGGPAGVPSGSPAEGGVAPAGAAPYGRPPYGHEATPAERGLGNAAPQTQQRGGPLPAAGARDAEREADGSGWGPAPGQRDS